MLIRYKSIICYYIASLVANLIETDFNRPLNSTNSLNTTMNAKYKNIFLISVPIIYTLITPMSFATNLMQQSSLTGDWKGARKELERQGISLNADYVSETVGVLKGGEASGVRYAQQFRLGATLNLNKLLNTEHAGSLQLTINDRRGRSTSADLLGNRLPTQEVYGGLYTRLSELSYTNYLFTPNLHYKLGLLAMGNDFGGMPIMCNFINAGFCGHPLSLSGGSGWGNYPAAHFGAELSYNLTANWAIQTALFNVNPEMSNRSERAFKPIGPGTTGYIVPVELIYQSPSALQRLYKLGYYYDTSNINRIDNPTQRSDKRWGAYLLADQTVWQSGVVAERNMHIFAQLTTTDRTTSPFRHWYSTGMVFNAPFTSRPNDSVALGFGRAVYNSASRNQTIRYLATSGAITAADNLSGAAIGEAILEMTYTLQATPWLSIRPSLQYIKNPGTFSNKSINNAWVTGVQLKVKF